MARYIDADVFVRLIKEKYRFNDFLSANSAQKIIDNIPAADVVPVVHAHWIEKHYVELKGTGIYAILGTCSNCNCEVITDESAEYCSNCRAVMDEEELHEMCFDFEKTFHGAKMDEEVQ